MYTALTEVSQKKFWEYNSRSVAIGVLVYDEHLRRGPLSGAALLALLLLLALSVVQLGKVEAAEHRDRVVEPTRET